MIQYNNTEILNTEKVVNRKNRKLILHIMIHIKFNIKADCSKHEHKTFSIP